MLADITTDDHSNGGYSGAPPDNYSRLRELSRTAQAAMLRRYMAYMAGADEPDDSDPPGLSDKAAHVWELAQSGIKGAIRLGYKRTRSLAHADETGAWICCWQQPRFWQTN